MSAVLELGNIPLHVVRKDIKNVHLSVYPPVGRVRIAAPLRMNLDTIRLFAISKLAWIKRQQKVLREQERETQREYLDRESHYVWGKRYLLALSEGDTSPSIELKHNHIFLKVRTGADILDRENIVESWYRQQIKEALPSLIAMWEPLLGVSVNHFFVQRMKTKWGSCSPKTRNIRLNTELAKKPRECLEYIVVHEMVHLLESTHNAYFVSLMDRFMPRWQSYREELNRLPVRHENWEY